MKTPCSKQKKQAMTLIEVLVVIFILIALAAMLIPASNGGRGRAIKINCSNNLKQIGLAYKIWASDNTDKYPMEVSVTNGGIMELLDTADAWRTFQVMSNELGSPKIIYCMADSTHDTYATNFGDGLKNKISYFIGMDATVTNANSLLSGDDHFRINGSPVKSGSIVVTSNTPIEWDSARHVSVETYAWFLKKKIGYGNIGLGDGSVQSLSTSTLLGQIKQTGLATNRLAIP